MDYSPTKILYIESISEYETLTWNGDGEETIYATLDEVMSEKKKDPNITCIDMTIRSCKESGNFIVCCFDGDSFCVNSYQDDLLSVKIVSEPERILEFFDESRDGDTVLVPEIPNHNIYKDREFLKKFLSHVPSLYKDFNIFDDYELAEICVKSSLDDNLGFVTVDDHLFKVAIEHNVENWGTKLDTCDNMLLIIKSIELNVKYNEATDDGPNFNDLLDHICDAHPECIRKACDWYCSPITLFIKQSMSDGWANELPEKAIYAILESGHFCMTEF